jgi:uncharacterized membrane protein
MRLSVESVSGKYTIGGDATGMWFAVVPRVKDDRLPATGRHVLENVETIAKLEADAANNQGPLHRVSSRITRFTGSAWFVVSHVAWFGAWVAANTISPNPFDPYPFTFLTFLVSLEAIFLSSFVLISQNQMEQQAHRRAALDLQINLLAEKEMTKVLSGVMAIAAFLGIEGVCDDRESQEMATDTNVEAIAHAVTEAAAAETGMQ